MGKHRFRLSDMIPNAWFYKLKDMNSNRRSNQNSMRRERGFHHAITASPRTPRKSFASPQSTPQKQSLVPNRASYYYSSETVHARKLLNSPVYIQAKGPDTHFPLEPPRKSKQRRSPRRHIKHNYNTATKLVSSSVSGGCNCVDGKEEDEVHKPAMNGECGIDACKVTSSSTDTIIDMRREHSSNYKILEETICLNHENLRPIITRSINKDKNYEMTLDSLGIRRERERNEKQMNDVTEVSSRVHNIRIRSKSPRIKTENAKVRQRRTKTKKGIAESFAMVKCSSNPQKDFRESMVEMIIENGICSSDDLEDLLACYLALNSSEYHDVIVKVFKQIWFDLKLRL